MNSVPPMQAFAAEGETYHHADWLRLDATEETARIADALRDQVLRRLRKRGLVLGLSGGIDSSVSAALAVAALGPAKVLGVLMPERDSDPDSLRLGRLVAETLGIDRQPPDYRNPSLFRHLLELEYRGLTSLGLLRPAAPDEIRATITPLFDGSMRGRTMYVVPFSMGAVGGPLSHIGVQITDSAYAVASIEIMTRVGTEVLREIAGGAPWVKTVHSVGAPLEPGEADVPWPCNDE